MNRNKEEHMQTLLQYLGEKKLEEALDYLEGLSAEERAYWEIENITGMICSYCGQYQEAVSFFRRALQSNPDMPDVYYNLADAYFCMQDYQHAELMLKCCEYITEDEQLLEGIKQMNEQIASARVGEVPKENTVLMVAYYFPPLSGSGVFRSLKFAKYLPELGWKTSVISAEEPPRGWNYRDDSMVREIPAEVDVVRIPDAVCTQQQLEMTKEYLSPVINFLKDVLKYDREALNIFGSFLTSQKGIMQMVTFPCGALCWAWEVTKYIEENVDLNKLDVIFTTSGPASAHLVGFYINKKYGIPWVADYRDQWTENPYGYFNPAEPMQNLLFRLETLLLKQATCNITIEQSLVQNYINKFGLKETQMTSITNGYDEEDFIDLDFSKSKTDKFTIGYSGLLYTQQRSIVPVLKAVKELSEEGKIDVNKICVRVVGKGNEEKNQKTVEEFGLNGILEQTGYVSHKEALQANLDSDMLLLLVGDEDKFKPVYTGKVFDYLRSGKPILALGPKDGAVDRLLSATGHGKTFLSTQTLEIKETILEEYKKWLNTETNSYFVSPAIKVHERKYLTMKLAEVLLERRRNLGGAGNNSKFVSAYKKYLVICTGGYPTENGRKTNMFAHKRILKYIEAGLNVDVFGFIWGDEAFRYTYQGVNVLCGGESQLIELLLNNHYEKLLIHFPDISVYNAIAKAGKMDMPILMWCHGYEVLPWHRTWFNHTAEHIRQNKRVMLATDETKKSFLKYIFGRENITFIFVSNWQRMRCKKWVGNLPKHSCVIHNFLDFKLFNIPEKRAEDRLHILSIKGHNTRMYANDLTAKAILELSTKPFFSELTFSLYGDGALFEQNFGELLAHNFPNVHIHREFLNQQQMKKLFEENGIFLSPTRMDSHQVTASEAMAAGMALVTSNAGPMREFVNEDCACIFEMDNPWMMAEEIEYLYYHPDEYVQLCKNAKIRAEEQCGDDKTVAKEIELILA